MNLGAVVNMYQGSAWPGGFETPLTATPSITLRRLKGLPPISPHPPSRVHLSTLFTVTLRLGRSILRCHSSSRVIWNALQCYVSIIIFCGWCGWQAQPGSSLRVHCHLLENLLYSRTVVMALPMPPTGKRGFGHGRSLAPNTWVHRAIFFRPLQLEGANSWSKQKSVVMVILIKDE